MVKWAPSNDVKSTNSNLPAYIHSRDFLNVCNHANTQHGNISGNVASTVAGEETQSLFPDASALADYNEHNNITEIDHLFFDFDPIDSGTISSHYSNPVDCIPVAQPIADHAGGVPGLSEPGKELLDRSSKTQVSFSNTQSLQLTLC